MPSPRTRLLSGGLALSLAGVLAACGGSPAPAGGNAGSAVASLQASATTDVIRAEKVDSIAAEVPQAIRDRGTLVLASGMGQNQYPPIAFFAEDQKTVIGYLPDVADLIAGVLGLKSEMINDSFEGAFLGIDSGKYDLFVSQVGVTSSRLEKYDMAPFGVNKYAFEVKKGSTLTVAAPEDLSGKKVAIKPGTQQATLMEGWNKQLADKGLPAIDLKSYAVSSGSALALQSGQVDAYLTIGVVADYMSSLPNSEIQVAGYFPGLEHDVNATVSKKDSGLGKPVCDAINHLIDNGDMDKVLAKWSLQGYGVERCDLNPTPEQ